ncbi:MAG: hypothetical protein KF812_04070 [Fimbriimonadaceae bacterium]|nr:hypothetical protein [Fimbriimonadaceae bacterium]
MTNAVPLVTLQSWDDFLSRLAFGRAFRNAFLVGILKLIFPDSLNFWLWWSTFTLMDIGFESLKRLIQIRRGRIKVTSPEEVKGWDGTTLAKHVKALIQAREFRQAIRLVMVSREVSQERAHEWVREIADDE